MLHELSNLGIRFKSGTLSWPQQPDSTYNGRSSYVLRIQHEDHEPAAKGGFQYTERKQSLLLSENAVVFSRQFSRLNLYHIFQMKVSFVSLQGI